MAAVATIAGAWLASDAAKSAANTQAGSARDANQLQWAMFMRNRADQAPWMQAGSGAVGRLSEMLGPNGSLMQGFKWNPEQDPGYQFRLGEGMKALQRFQSARGTLGGGGGLKAMQRYGQDYASQEYGNAYNRWNNEQSNVFNRLASLAGLGQTSTNQMGQYGMNAANQIGNNMTSAGAASAAGQMGAANAWGGAMNNLGNMWMMYQMMGDR